MACTVRSLLGSLGQIATSYHGAVAAARTTQAWTPMVTSVRHRYHKERMEKGPLLRNYGYKEKLHNKGLLPHMEHSRRLPIPIFRPSNSWAEKRALFGQNDYIDILGPGGVKPTQVAYTVPAWLRGFKGDEYQMLLRKRKVFRHQMSQYRPTKLEECNKRIKYLYRFLNQKTRDYWWKKA